MWYRNLISIFLLVTILCDKDVKSDSRKARLFTFNTVNEDIRVDLDFSIPFISIPVKQTMDTAFSSLGIPSVNVNVPALVLGGGVVLASTVLLPLLIKNFAAHPPNKRYSKILEHTQFGADAILDFTSEMLSDGGGVRGCALRVACWTGQHDQADAARTWSQVMSNQLISSFLNSSAVDEAVESGRRGRDCTFYTPCSLRADHYPTLKKYLALLTNNS